VGDADRVLVELLVSAFHRVAVATDDVVIAGDGVVHPEQEATTGLLADPREEADRLVLAPVVA
jgi:hypothetical protein